MTGEGKGLLATTDAQVWAEEFCRIFDVIKMTGTRPLPMSKNNQIGTMLGWFANAIEVGRSHGRQETCRHISGYTVLDGNERLCNICGKIFTVELPGST